MVNAAGCGFQLKDYAHMMHGTRHADAAARLQTQGPGHQRVPRRTRPGEADAPAERIKATYHDACHLRHAQQVFKQPRALLEMIPGLELVPLAESELCCGAAGSYNLTQPEMAGALGDRKADNIKRTGARAVFTGNVGCLMQITRHLRDAGLWVAHPVDALWASYSGQMPRELRV